MINEIPGTSSKRIKITKNNTAEEKAFKKHTARIEKMIARCQRPRDKKGRVIKKNIWGGELVRVKNKWMLRSDVSDS